MVELRVAKLVEIAEAERDRSRAALPGRRARRRRGRRDAARSSGGSRRYPWRQRLMYATRC